MKRSQINQAIRDMEALIRQHTFALPPFCHFTPQDWPEKNHEYDEIRDNRLGWDVTDYGAGDFDRIGFSLITLRNGNLKNQKYTKTYAEKLLMIKENQYSPMHFHWNKMEDIRTGEGFDYLCQVRDVLTNTVLASYQSETMKMALVSQTVKMAQERWRLPADVIFHSDRGSQYTAKELMKQVAGFGWTQSFSRVGKPDDNAWSESFFSILKKEIIHWRFYATRDEARQRIFEYIEVFYNRKRAQKRLGYLSPIQYLEQWQQSHFPAVA